MTMVLFLYLTFLIPFAAQGISANQVVVYYFHTTFRCPTCYKIEQYTEEAINRYFPKELQSGRLSFKSINVEQKENQHFIKDYQLFSKSVVISLIKAGQEVKYNNLTKIWIYFTDKQKFYDYIKTETAKYLQEIE